VREALLPLAGCLGVGVAVAHGYLGEKRLIAPLEIPGRQAKGFIRAIWQLSAATWILCSLIIALSPWFVPDNQRMVVVVIVSLPMLYGLVVNAWISRGRHFGWKLLSLVLGMTAVGIT
jgi:hypothetical protein